MFLFTVVLHSRHGRRRFFPLLLFSESHNLVVFVRRQNTNERHHSGHEATPTGAEAVVFRLVHHFVHRHHGAFHERVLRESGNGIRILAHVRRSHLHTRHVLVLHLSSSLERRI